jgi:hypothetical protein
MQCRKKRCAHTTYKIASLLLFIAFVDVAVQNPALVLPSVYFSAHTEILYTRNISTLNNCNVTHVSVLHDC